MLTSRDHHFHEKNVENEDLAKMTYSRSDLVARGGDSHCQTDGDDGDGQGGRFWAEQHRPKGEAPFKRAAGGKNFEP